MGGTGYISDVNANTTSEDDKVDVGDSAVGKGGSASSESANYTKEAVLEKEFTSTPSVEALSVYNDKKKSIWTSVTIALCGVAMSSGTLANIGSKWSYRQSSYPCDINHGDSCPMKQYSDFIAQAGFREIVATVVSGSVYLLDRHMSKRLFKRHIFMTEESHQAHRELIYSSKVKLYLSLVVTGLLDFTFGLFQSLGNVLLRSSTVQMIVNAQLIFTAIFGMLLFKRAYNVYHYIAVLVIFSGLVIGGIDGILEADDSIATEYAGKQKWGILTVIIAALFKSLNVTLDQYFLEQWTVPVLKYQCLQTFFGSLGWLLVQVILLAVCVGHTPEDMVYDSYCRFKASWYMAINEPLLWVSQFLHGTCAVVMNGCLIVIGNLCGAVFRMVIQGCRGPATWLLELCLKWSAFTWLALIGWIILITGVLLYSGLLATWNPDNKLIQLRRPVLFGMRLEAYNGSYLTPNQEKRKLGLGTQEKSKLGNHVSGCYNVVQQSFSID